MFDDTGAQRISKTALGALGAVCLAGLLTACSGDAGGGSGQSSGAQDEPVPGQGTPSESIEGEIVGTWSSDEPGDPSVDFTEEGSVEGTDGCNPIEGSYTVEGEEASLELEMTTMEECPDVDDWLKGISIVTIEGETMEVQNADGEDIGVLQRDG